ncbi:MAG TPA: hypothetical protein VGN42_07340 [Pirellulales bacterium]|jgi:hypothetical protein|nr:hypothetical protein [Pirellulales bacterium]
MSEPQLTIEAFVDEDEVARSAAQLQRVRQNCDWLGAHWPELLPAARGKFLAVAGRQAFLADSPEEAWQMAEAAFPDDDGALVQYVRALEGPRFYANQG